MNIAGRGFEVDRRDGKLLGVCAGLADATGVDAVIYRIGFVLGTLLLGGVHGIPWALAIYGALALIGGGARRRAGAAARAQGAQGAQSPACERARALSAQAIETCAASGNSALAREIDALR